MNIITNMKKNLFKSKKNDRFNFLLSYRKKQILFPELEEKIPMNDL